MISKAVLRYRAKKYEDQFSYEIDKESFEYFDENIRINSAKISSDTSPPARHDNISIKFDIDGKSKEVHAFYCIIVNDDIKLDTESEAYILGVDTRKICSGIFGTTFYRLVDNELMFMNSAEFRKSIFLVDKKYIDEMSISKISLKNSSDRFRFNSFVNSFAINRLKYRYIELFRILENLYIHEQYKYIVNNFLISPKKVVGEVSKNISGEIEQLLHISTIKEMQTAFEKIYQDIDNEVNRGNKFAKAVKEKLTYYTNTRNLKMEYQYKKGGAMLYAIRCAIVHSGEIDIVYENFDDGDELLDQLMPNMVDLGWSIVRR